MKKLAACLQTHIMVLVFGFLYVPIAVLIAFSFNESQKPHRVHGLYLQMVPEPVPQRHDSAEPGRFAGAWPLRRRCIATVVGTLAAIGINSMNTRARGAVHGRQLCARRQPGDRHRRFADAAVRGVQPAGQRGALVASAARGELRASAWHAAHRAHHVLPALCASSTSAPSCARWTRAHVRGRAGPWLQSPAGVFQGGAAARSCRPSCRRFSSASTYSIDDFIICLFHLRHQCRRCPSPSTP